MTTPTSRPSLTKKTKADEFLSFYWLKKELIKFCALHSLSTTGSKEELTKRISLYLTIGKSTPNSTVFKAGVKDSDNPLTLSTIVKHYKNDKKTRDFFIKYIGPQFHFNSYLRQFNKQAFKNNHNLTYGDLIDGWKNAQAYKESRNNKPSIGAQFEFNQF